MVRCAPPLMPPTNMRHHGLAIITAASPWSMKRDRRGRKGAAGNEERQQQQPCGRRQPPPPSAVTDRTRQEEHTGPSRPGRAQKGLVKSPSPRYSRRTAVSTTPRTSRISSALAGAAADEIEPSPPRPRWGPKRGPDLGREGVATIHRASPPPRGRVAVPWPPGATPPEQPPPPLPEPLETEEHRRGSPHPERGHRARGRTRSLPLLIPRGQGPVAQAGGGGRSARGGRTLGAARGAPQSPRSGRRCGGTRGGKR
nr:serine/arginine repetitive matrix protein 1-like [Aegilops tauschii subsp. strangulata]